MGAAAAAAQVRSRHRGLYMDLNSICTPSQAPHLFAVGGGDPWMRIYDRRMASSSSTMPTLKAGLLRICTLARTHHPCAHCPLQLSAPFGQVGERIHIRCGVCWRKGAWLLWTPSQLESVG